MVRNVGNLDYLKHINFKCNDDNVAKNLSAPVSNPQINDIKNITPDYNVKIPQNYKKIGVDKLSNGLELHSYKLSNGYRITIVPMEGSPTVVKNYVNVGAMNETPDIKGISHFLEHMAFNGTNGENGHLKLNVGDSFKKIDELGGWANASTNYAVTDYVNSSPLLENKDLETQIKVIASMTEDLALTNEMIEKEKGPVCSEINMIMDDPQTVAFDQTVRTLFNIKNPADELIAGSVEHIKNLTRKNVLEYYNKYYTPDNMNLVITGDINPEETIKLVAKNFNSKKTSVGKKFEEKLTPIEHTVRKDFVSDKAKSSQIVLGFLGAQNDNSRDKLIFNILNNYLRSYSSDLEKNLRKYNSYPYIGKEKISNNPKCNEMVYVAVSTSDKNTELVLKGIYNAINNLKPITEERLEELKENIKNSRNSYMEFSENVNTEIGNRILNNNYDGLIDFDNIIDSITVEDVNNAMKKTFDLNKVALTVVHPSQKNEEIVFKGNNRKPIKTQNVEEVKLQNNFDVGLYKTKNNNLTCTIDYKLNKPYQEKAGVIEVLDRIYLMGTKNLTEDEFNELQEKNNFTLDIALSPSAINVYSKTGQDNCELCYQTLKELLYNPAITEENLKIAKEKVKDSFSRSQDTAYSLYADYEAENNNYEFSKKEVLENIDNITIEDVKKCHQYLLNNSRAIATANVPDSKPEMKNDILGFIKELNPVKPNEYVMLDTYVEREKVNLLTKANNNSQADIMQVYNFRRDDSIKGEVTGKLMNSILTNSSIGLFNTLREKEQLAYSVHSELINYGNSSDLLLRIGTTTDNKETGEKSYENVQKSIDGFNHQLGELKSGKFTDQDLINAKKSLKARLLENEGTFNKLYSIKAGLNSKNGIFKLNEMYNTIDTITKEDIIEFANKATVNPPTYTITASQDTLDFNKSYLEELV